jgi:hypothetical protein
MTPEDILNLEYPPSFNAKSQEQIVDGKYVIEQLLDALVREEEIIRKEKAKEFSHLSYSDGRRQTLSRVRANVSRLKVRYDTV